MQLLEQLVETEACIRATAVSISSAIDAVHGNASAARQAIAFHLQHVIDSGVDAALARDSATSLLEEVDLVEQRKVSLLEAEAVSVDEALEIIMQGREDATLDAFHLDRVQSLIDIPTAGPSEPLLLSFIAGPLTDARLGTIAAPSAVTPQHIALHFEQRVWEGRTTVAVTLSLLENERVIPLERDAQLEALKQSLRVSARIVTSRFPTLVEPRLRVALHLVPNAVEVWISVPAVSQSGDSFVDITHFSLRSEPLLVHLPLQLPIARELKTPLIIPSAVAGVPRGRFLACSSLAGTIFIAARSREDKAAQMRAVASLPKACPPREPYDATLVHGYAGDGAPTFPILRPALLGLPPHILAMTYDDVNNALVLSLGGGHAPPILASIAPQTLAVRWVARCQHEVSSLVILPARQGLLVAVEGRSLRLHWAIDGVPHPEASHLTCNFWRTRLALYNERDYPGGLASTRVCTLPNENDTSRFVMLRWHDAEERFIDETPNFAAHPDLRGRRQAWPAFYDSMRPSDPLSTLLPPAPKFRPEGVSATRQYPVLIYPAGASYTLCGFNTFASRCLIPLPGPQDKPVLNTFDCAGINGIVAAATGTAVILAERSGNVRVLNWPLLASPAERPIEVERSIDSVYVASSIREAATAKGGQEGSILLHSVSPTSTSHGAQYCVGHDAAVLIQPEGSQGFSEIVSRAAQGSIGEPRATVRPAQEKYAHLAAHARLAVVVDSDYPEIFGRTKQAFDALPRWKREQLQKAAGMF